MSIPFTKYHGTGNDFIMVDQTVHHWIQPDNRSLVARMCDRHFGIGADGLILIQSTGEADFQMIYFNADGGVGTLCGNGSRCAVHFARTLGVAFTRHQFLAADGIHAFSQDERDWIGIHMADPLIQSSTLETYLIDTGSPHFIRFMDELTTIDVVQEGRAIRNRPEFPQGINVNFVQWADGRLRVKTYERGVEDMTLSCGTGATASSIALALKNQYRGEQSIPVDVPGGSLEIRFREQHATFTEVWLWGPATPVFTGSFPEKVLH